MNEKLLNRLAVVREKLGWTQAAMGNRAGYSTVYVVKLESASRKPGACKPMSKPAAVAFACATGAHPLWLQGKLPASPVVDVNGAVWKPEAAQQSLDRQRGRAAAHEQADYTLITFMIYSWKLARVCLAAYRQRRPMLARNRIAAAIGTAAAEFKVPAEKLPFPVYRDSKTFSPTGADEAAAAIVKTLIRELTAEIKKRPP